MGTRASCGLDAEGNTNLDLVESKYVHAKLSVLGQCTDLFIRRKKRTD